MSITTEPTTDELTYSTIEMIVAVPAMLHIPLLKCGHAGHCSTDRSAVGEVGDRRRCLTCKREEGKR
jgi:hypothetical protein